MSDESGVNWNKLKERQLEEFAITIDELTAERDRLRKALENVRDEQIDGPKRPHLDAKLLVASLRNIAIEALDELSPPSTQPDELCSGCERIFCECCDASSQPDRDGVEK